MMEKARHKAWLISMLPSGMRAENVCLLSPDSRRPEQLIIVPKTPMAFYNNELVDISNCHPRWPALCKATEYFTNPPTRREWDYYNKQNMETIYTAGLSIAAKFPDITLTLPPTIASIYTLKEQWVFPRESSLPIKEACTIYQTNQFNQITLGTITDKNKVVELRYVFTPWKPTPNRVDYKEVGSWKSRHFETSFCYRLTHPDRQNNTNPAHYEVNASLTREEFLHLQTSATT